MVEFALAVPIFLLLVFGMIDLTRYFFTEQSLSHTLRAAARYAITGQLKTNTSYDSNQADSFPYKSRRESIIAAAQANNPAGIPIVAGPTNYTANDNLTIMSSTNFNGPWVTNSSTGIGGDYVKIELRTDFHFVTPFLNQIASGLSPSTSFLIRGSIIMKNEGFQTNAISSRNDQGSSTNYWN